MSKWVDLLYLRNHSNISLVLKKVLSYFSKHFFQPAQFLEGRKEARLEFISEMSIFNTSLHGMYVGGI